MRTSHYLRNVIHRDQTLSYNEYFDEQANQSFSSSGSSWLDLCIYPRRQRRENESKDVKTGLEKTTASGDDELLLEGSVSCSPHSRINDESELRRIQESDAARLQMFFIRQRNSRSRLSVNRPLFEALCKRYEVFEKIREYVLCFGVKSSDVQINPPAMRFYLSSDCNPSSSDTSYEEFEGAYVVRFVEPNNRADGIPWSLRQSGVYHKFRGIRHTSTWIFLALSSTLEQQLDTYLLATQDEDDLNPFEIHFMLFDAAMVGWRGCVTYLGGEIQKQSDLVFMAEFEMDDFTMTRLEERQYTKKIEDFILDVNTAISFMLENLDCIIEFYRSRSWRVSALASTTRSRSGAVEQERRSDPVLTGFEQRRRDLLIFQAQTKALQEKVQSVSDLISNILDLNNGNALKLLAVETRLENANMAILTKKSVQDAATVKVLTIITLVYLPLTVVTNFFSTSFVNTSTAANGSSRITVTSDIWILFAAGAPLTILTIYAWWIFAQKETKGRYPGRLEDVVQQTKIALARSAKFKKSSTDIEKPDTD